MVRMTTNHNSLYPNLTNWVKNTLPEVQNNDLVWPFFLLHSELSHTEGVRALSWGPDPILYIKQIPGRNGEFDSQNPQRIILARDIAQRFEQDYLLPEAQRLVESTVLHELVHWGDHKDGRDQPGEEGLCFEKQAYGENVQRYWTDSTTSLREWDINVAKAARDNGCCVPPFKPKLSDSRGVRNNNPGNIRIGDPWQGLAKRSQMKSFQKNETEFCVFSAPKWGIRAMARILIYYQDKYNLQTVSEMINRWAKSSNNDTSEYIRFVSQKMKIGSNKSFTVAEYNRAYPMVDAMIRMENGIQPYMKRQIDRGLLLAGIEEA